MKCNDLAYTGTVLIIAGGAIVGSRYQFYRNDYSTTGGVIGAVGGLSMLTGFIMGSLALRNQACEPSKL
jgi:hypothetical protein